MMKDECFDCGYEGEHIVVKGEKAGLECPACFHFTETVDIERVVLEDG